MLTDKQKEAINLMVGLRDTGSLKEEDFFLLLDFVMGGQQQVQYVPLEIPSSPVVNPTFPLTNPWVTFHTTSKQEIK